MIDDIVLRWVVTILFALAAAQCAYLMLTRRMPWEAYVGHVLHLVMSVAMLVMAWPFSADWPTAGPMWFFVVAAAWFLVSLALHPRLRPTDDCGCVPPTTTPFGRLAAVYHATMMGAMAWMYAVMNGIVLPGGPTTQAMAMGSPGPSVTVLAHNHDDMPGMNMPGMDVGHHAAQPGYVTPVNWILTIGFALAAAVWLYLYFARRRAPGASTDLMTFAGDLCQVFMAVGMAIMFGVMLG
ncbi:putative integral membrane protein [Gordonia polyisoprenivorans VH2]|uniref:Putative integral membrane protein n=1 Tax=Gordonia polyisoprenivorans (strain DSM 44266 / VH2) TaxID=1112204 RepID=H6N3V1_GORPV|nr:DUF5134 domain-containing protein [Gordonia polyisoprenivorans]AFA74774.1 putative integral membrane protein [Gordonia polyisoprenivorans VH2]QUD83875.1 DUF5134 domain-containing protein [Gordonia polyisoprenivorans]HCS59014.1 DUF5134 domain-containing protein [Gordonia polyisoprenivorans]